jgi:type IV pilus assembly protein PilA
VIEAIQRRLAARSEQEREGGFTLIELMVVVMIIAILVGIAIPAFLGARKRAQDTASKSNIRNALSTAQTVFTDNQAYGTSAVLLGLLTPEEPALTFLANTANSTKAKEISVLTANTAGSAVEDQLYLASASASGKCFFLSHISTAGVNLPSSATYDNTKPSSGSYMAETATNTACSANTGAGLAVAGAWKAL